MLTHGRIGFVTHFFVHPIHPTGNRLNESATPYNGIEGKRNMVILQPIEHQLTSEIALIFNTLKLAKFLIAMTNSAYAKWIFAYIHCHFG